MEHERRPDGWPAGERTVNALLGIAFLYLAARGFAWMAHLFVFEMGPAHACRALGWSVACMLFFAALFGWSIGRSSRHAD